mgnify:CR=1 FL=1
MPNQGALANLDHDAALAEISSGVIADTIAQRHGVTAQAVRIALQRARPEDYKQAVANQVEHWVFDSAREMDELPADAVCIARARARGDFRLKLASKLNPDYADKQHVEHTGGMVVEHKLTMDAGALLDGVAERVTERVKDTALIGVEYNTVDNQGVTP